MPSAVGLIIGFIFGKHPPIDPTAPSDLRPTGGVNIVRFGAGPTGLMRTLAQYMLGSAATFGSVYVQRLRLRLPI